MFVDSTYVVVRGVTNIAVWYTNGFTGFGWGQWYEQWLTMEVRIL